MIDKELLLKVAKTARLNLTEEEITSFLPELDAILDTFSELKEVDTEKIEPSFQPLPIIGRTRDDLIKKPLSQKEALKNSISKEGYIKGPKIIEN